MANDVTVDSIRAAMAEKGWDLDALLNGYNGDIGEACLAMGWAPPQSQDGAKWRQLIDETCASDRAEQQAKSQAFFQTLADSIRPVHVGHERKAFVAELLLRAQEAGLYEPPKGTP